MDALVGGEVQGKVSVVFALFGSLRPQSEQARGQDLADLGRAFGGRHETRIEGVAQRRSLLRRGGEPPQTAFAVDDR
jgi:hypothetical protein